MARHVEYEIPNICKSCRYRVVLSSRHYATGNNGASACVYILRTGECRPSKPTNTFCEVYEKRKDNEEYDFDYEDDEC